jgi:ABC-2 type transport system permease protein
MFSLLLKEFTLLKRDILGLLVLFVMPAVLLIVITCIQNINYNNTAVTPATVILVNNDSDISNRNFLDKNNTGGIKFITQINDKSISKKEAKNLLVSGQYEAMLYIPENTAQHIGNRFETLFKQRKNIQVKSANKMQLIFSESINPILAKSLEEALSSASIKTQMHYLTLNIFKELDKKPPTENLPVNSWINTSYASANKNFKRPNTIQQNVPAWALFGMFFIVVPLSTTFIHERKSSVMLRLKTTTMNSFSFIFAKLIAYVIINIIQLSLMIAIGVYLLPVFGIPRLEIEGHINDIFIIGLFSAFAATSFGILIGSISNNQHQASMTGPVLIVIAAAIGGIMVPTFLMPPVIQRFCEYSPLYWGHSAFLDILVKHQSLLAVTPELTKLFIFFIACFTISWIIFRKKN